MRSGSNRIRAGDRERDDRPWSPSRAVMIRSAPSAMRMLPVASSTTAGQSLWQLGSSTGDRAGVAAALRRACRPRRTGRKGE